MGGGNTFLASIGPHSIKWALSEGHSLYKHYCLMGASFSWLLSPRQCLINMSVDSVYTSFHTLHTSHLWEKAVVCQCYISCSNSDTFESNRDQIVFKHLNESMPQRIKNCSRGQSGFFSVLQARWSLPNKRYTKLIMLRLKGSERENPWFKSSASELCVIVKLLWNWHSGWVFRLKSLSHQDHHSFESRPISVGKWARCCVIAYLLQRSPIWHDC